MLCPNDPHIKVRTQCPVCGTERIVSVDPERYAKWMANEGVIQELLPELNADEREALMTGLCSGCWSKMFQ